MNVLVTGGAGFIGSHLVDRLLADGARVMALDNFDNFYSERRKLANLAQAINHPRFQLVRGDIRNAEFIDSLIQTTRPEIIVHLAARAGVRPSIEQPRLYTEVNVVGTVQLLEAACRIDPKPRFIYASSSSVYGNRPNAPFRESDQVDHPISPYAATKKSCELIAYSFHHLYALPTTGLRFFTAYGPRNRPDLAIFKFANLIDAGLPIPMFGDGSTRRDYTYVADIVDGIVRSIDHCKNYHIYNLGNSKPVELKTMIEMLAEALGKHPIIERHPEQPGDVPMTCADTSLAETELGYQATTSFQQGIAHFVDWFRREASGI